MQNSFRCLLPMVLFSISSPSHAHNINGGSQSSSSVIPASVNLELDIVGFIRPRCELELSSNHIETILTDNPGSTNLPLKVNCNQRMSVSMTSLNGGLLHEKNDVWDKSGGFTGFVPYDLEFSIATDGATSVSLESEKIKGIEGGGSMGVVPFQTKGNLRLNWVPEGKLFGGRYGDIIEIRVSGEGETGHP